MARGDKVKTKWAKTFIDSNSEPEADAEPETLGPVQGAPANIQAEAQIQAQVPTHAMAQTRPAQAQAPEAGALAMNPYRCGICRKDFVNLETLNLHAQAHELEKSHKCEHCQMSFSSQGHLQKHMRSSTHEARAKMTDSFGIASVDNPRPYGCPECGTAFRKHGHLAKHLRSKSHITRLESRGLIPRGTYAALEKSGQDLKDKLVTSNFELSLSSMRELTVQLFRNGAEPQQSLPLPVSLSDRMSISNSSTPMVGCAPTLIPAQAQACPGFFAPVAASSPHQQYPQLDPVAASRSGLLLAGQQPFTTPQTVFQPHQPHPSIPSVFLADSAAPQMLASSMLHHHHYNHHHNHHQQVHSLDYTLHNRHYQ